MGSLTNPEKLKNAFRSVKKSKITSATIKKYLGYFEDSFLLESAHRYDIKGKAYIETPRKYYFSDLSLRNARLNFRQFEPTHAMENVIYNELCMRGYNVDIGVVPIAERNENSKVIRKQLEVDYVCNLGSVRYYIQSAYSILDEQKRIQETRPFTKIDDSFKKIVITRDIVPPNTMIAEFSQSVYMTFSLIHPRLKNNRFMRPADLQNAGMFPLIFGVVCLLPFIDLFPEFSVNVLFYYCDK